MKALLVALVLLAGPVWAKDPAIGIWKTPPDRKNLTSLIEVRACGKFICGRILKAFDPSGKEVSTPNIGKELFWGMVPHGDGGYSAGTAFVPLLNIQAKGSMTLAGNRLTVRGCKGPICDSQVWTRVK